MATTVSNLEILRRWEKQHLGKKFSEYDAEVSMQQLADQLTVYKRPGPCQDRDCSVCVDLYRLEDGQTRAFYAYTHSIDSTSAKAIIDKHNKSIANCFNNICELVSTRGNDILQRWGRISTKKKKPQQRKEEEELLKYRTSLLEKALPAGTPRRYGTHFGALVNGTLTNRHSVVDRSRYRQTCLLPWLTIEDLGSDPSKLLRLLDIRTRFNPSQWAWTDYVSSRHGRYRGQLAMVFSDAMVSIRGPDYGQFVAYDYDAVHRWHVLGYPTAEILFEAQSRLYSLLEDVTRAILAETSNTASGCDVWQAQATLSFQKAVPQAKEQARNLLRFPVQHFEPPAIFDLIQIMEVADERETVAKEELWNLHNDPILAFEAVDAIVQGRFFETTRNEDRWSAIAVHLADPLLRRIRIWSTIKLVVQTLQKAQTGCIVRVGESTSVSYVSLSTAPDATLGTAYALVKGELNFELRPLLKDILKKDQQFDEFFTKAIGSVKVAMGRDARTKSLEEHLVQDAWGSFPSAEILENAPLLVALTTYCNYNRYAYYYVLETAHYLEEALRRLLSEGKDLDDLVPTRILHPLEDMAAGLWILQAFESHIPRARPINLHAPNFEVWNAIERAVMSEKPKDQGGVRCADYDNIDERTALNKSSNAGKHLERFYGIGCPPERKRSITWLKRAAEAKQALNEFWFEIRAQHLEERWGTASLSHSYLHGCEECHILGGFERSITLASLQHDIAVKEKALENSKQKPATSKSPTTPTKRAATQTEFGTTQQSPTKRQKQLAREAKEAASKKRPDRAPIEQTPAPEPPRDPSPTLPPPKIIVSKANLNSLAHLWPYQAQPAPAGTIRWKDFCNAMAGTGLAVLQGSGSAVTFEKEGSSIVMHGPHGSGGGAIPKAWLGSFAYRLEERFGWAWETFVLRDKEGKGNEEGEEGKVE